MLTVRNIFKRYGPVKVLLGVGFSIAKGQKVALVGPNGVGKSTLLRILAGEESEDKGTIERGKRLRVAFLPQELVSETTEETVIGYLRRISGIDRVEADMTRLEADLSDEEKLVEYGELRELHERLGGYRFEEKSRKALDGLGLSRIGFHRKLSEMSGGERRRVSLSAVLLEESDLLLLDEPTNDLDLPSILWLEHFLRNSSTAVIVSSHDREFLDAVSEKVLEIDWHFRMAKMWAGNYSTYFHEKSEELRLEKESYVRAEEERSRLNTTAEQKREWAKIGSEYKMPDKDKMSQGFHRDRSQQKFGAAARALFTRSGKVKKIELHAERDPLELLFEPSPGEEREIVLRDAVSGYASDFRVGPVNLDIPYGSRVGIFGENGSGKSTLLRMIVGELPVLSGSVHRGAQVTFGVLSQGNDMIPRNVSALAWFSSATPLSEEADIARFLGKFLLEESALSFPMGELSPGERMRLSLGFLMATGVSALVLDEPTNHLDLDAVSSLASALDLFKGTLFLVSHDRAFLSGVEFSKVISLKEGVCSSEKDYQTYLDTVLREIGKSL